VPPEPDLGEAGPKQVGQRLAEALPQTLETKPLIAENVPADRIVKAKTEATTIKAMRIMAVSRAVRPRSS
jgi:hypothetical protein